MRLSIATFGLLMIASSSCQDSSVQSDNRRNTGATSPAVQSNDQKPGQTISSIVLNLSWEASTGTVTGYHVYGLTEEKNAGGTEVASLIAGTDNLLAPKARIDLSTTKLPQKGKVCFYVVAENKEVSSLASTPACLNL